jgi:hypothetical protein
MSRTLPACWLALFICGSTIAAAQESTIPTRSNSAGISTRSVSEGISTRGVSEAAKSNCVCQHGQPLEAILREPAGLEFAADKRVTVGDIFDQLHRQHGFSIRFDVPTLSQLYGGVPPQEPRSIGIGRSDDASVTATGEKLPPAYNGPKPSADYPPPATAASHPASSRRTPEPVVRAQAPAGVAATAALPQSLPPTPASPSTPATSTEAPVQPLPPGTPPAVASESHCNKETGCEAPDNYQSLLELALKTEVDVRRTDLTAVSVATALRIALESMPCVDTCDDAAGLPITLTDASLFDYLVDGDGILITTRLAALAHKETRVYSVKHLKDCTSSQLATVIRQSVRPWSWRSRIDDIGDQLRASTAHVPPKALGSVLKAGFQAAADATGVSLASDQADDKSDAKSDAKKPAAEMSDAEQAEMLGNAVVNGLVTFAHTTLTALEIAHYADPPTGSIQTLPGKLIITQSQAAHREIADLLKQLGDE